MGPVPEELVAAVEVPDADDMYAIVGWWVGDGAHGDVGGGVTLLMTIVGGVIVWSSDVLVPPPYEKPIPQPPYPGSLSPDPLEDVDWPGTTACESLRLWHVRWSLDPRRPPSPSEWPTL